MIKIHKTILAVVIISLFMSFNAFATNGDKDCMRTTPETEKKYEDRTLNYRWTWLDDERCAQFRLTEKAKKSDIEKRWDMGVISGWIEPIHDGRGTWKAKQRYTYEGKWSQSEEGIWSFTFDDYTIPVGPTKIDGVLYAFNGYGELQEGYNYWGDLKTAADGLVTSDDPEFLAWLATQYVPECFTQTETADTGASGPGQNN